jgi:hypothetical protein
MATKLSYDLTYDAAPADVAAMLLDPAFREEVCTAQGGGDTTVEVTEEGGGHKVVVDQTQGVEGIPGFAKKFVGESVNLVQTEHWADAESGTVEVVIPGKPGEMRGTIRLAEAGGTTTEHVEMEIKVGIPLVGGKIEGLISDLLKKALKAENKVGREYLAG